MAWGPGPLPAIRSDLCPLRRRASLMHCGQGRERRQQIALTGAASIAQTKRPRTRKERAAIGGLVSKNA
jgi:hypothetical protein